jgi:hypothetical protein
MVALIHTVVVVPSDHGVFVDIVTMFPSGMLSLKPIYHLIRHFWYLPMHFRFPFLRSGLKITAIALRYVWSVRIGSRA